MVLTRKSNKRSASPALQEATKQSSKQQVFERALQFMQHPDWKLEHEALHPWQPLDEDIEPYSKIPQRILDFMISDPEAAQLALNIPRELVDHFGAVDRAERAVAEHKQRIQQRIQGIIDAEMENLRETVHVAKRAKKECMHFARVNDKKQNDKRLREPSLEIFHEHFAHEQEPNFKILSWEGRLF